MRQTYKVTVKKKKSHFLYQHIKGNTAYKAQVSIETERGKNTDITVDFEAQTVVVSNKLFKVTHQSFQEDPYFE